MPVFVSWRSYDCYEDEVNLATLSFGDITSFKTVVSMSVYYSMEKICSDCRIKKELSNIFGLPKLGCMKPDELLRLNDEEFLTTTGSDTQLSSGHFLCAVCR